LNDFTKAIQCLSAIMNRDYTTYYHHVKIEVGNLVSKYELKFGGVRFQRPQQANNGGGKKVCSWNRLVGSGSPSTNASSAHSASPAHSTLSIGSELTSYRNSDHVSQFDDSFNILSWCHDHRKNLSYLVYFS
jgi:hypothetical protein